jgi:hypothetical protein
MPMVPYVILLLQQGVPRFHLVADLALMEYDTRHVWNGDTLLGLGSRFGWSHPGPIFFYVAAPFEKLFGASSVGIYVAATVVSACAIAAIVTFSRALGGRVHGAAATAIVIAWLAAFGNVAVDPWVRTIAVLPLFAYLVLAAFFATGNSVVAAPAVFFAAVAGQTHLSTVPTVGIVGIGALAAFSHTVRRRGGLTVRERRHLLLAAGLLVLTLLPPLIDQVAPSRSGNLGRVARFFLHRREPHLAMDVALRYWVLATGWLPERIVNGRLLEDDGVPFGMRWDEVPAHASGVAVAIALLRLAMMAGAAVVAWRRLDRTSLAFLAFAALGDLLSVWAIRSIVGEVQYSLLFWTTAPSSLGWLGVASAFGGAARDATSRRGLPRTSAVLPLAALGIAAVATTTLQRSWLAHYPWAPASDPYEVDVRRQIYEVMREEARQGKLIPVVHLAGSWPLAISFILEHDRDGAEVRIGDPDVAAFPGGRTAATAPRVRHYWFGDAWNPLAFPLGPCVEHFTRGGITVVEAKSADRSCEPSP